MEAVILAGGYGTRLRPLTYKIPKPLIPIANKPMVIHIIDSLPRRVEKVILAVSYKRDMLQGYFEENPPEGRELVLVEEKEPLGTGGAIKNVEREISGDFLAFNGDVISSLDPSVLINTLIEKKAGAVISLWRVKDPSHYGVVEIRDGWIRRFVEKPKSEEAPSNLISAGAYAISYDVLDLIPPGRVVSLEREIWPIVVEKGMCGVEFEGYWTDAGTRERVLEANALMLRKIGKKSVVGGGSEILGKVMDGTSVGRQVIVEEGAEVRNSIIMDGCILKKGSKVDNSIIGPEERVAGHVYGEIMCSLGPDAPKD